MNKLPLIAPKPFADFTDVEYHAHVQAMYALRVKGRAKPTSPAPGLTVTLNKKSILTIRRTKRRAFDYVTWSELEALAVQAKCSKADLWQLFKRRKFIVAQTRMEAEKIYAAIKETPW